jgi:pimeloyl-ACP methyl ester carboxylesterase
MGWVGGDDPGYFYRDHHALEREVLAALEALRQTFGDRVAPGPVVYAGYSQGGVMGALMVVNHPETFQRVILVEGGEREWDVPTAMKFREGGGKRVLLVCGRHVCSEAARKSVWWLRRGQVDVRHESVSGGGHTYGGAVGQRLADTFGWVVRDDPRWGAW